MDVLFIGVVFPFFFVFVFAFFIFLRCSFPFYLPFLLVLLALASVIASSATQAYVSNLKLWLLLKGAYPVFSTSFIYSACIEETYKIFFFYIVFKFIPSLSEYKKQMLKILNFSKNDGYEYKKDFTLIAMFFASAFAGFENVAYFIYEPKLILCRLLTASLLHITISSVYVDIFRKNKLFLLEVFFVSILLHGFYNFFIFLEKSFIAYATVALISAISLVRFMKFRKKLV